MTDVLLIVPPFTYGALRGSASASPSLGIATVAAVLEKGGYRVEILDALALGMNKEEIKNEIRRVDAPLVGITVVTSTFHNAIDILRLAKEVAPKCKTIIGGPHVTILPETLIDLPYVDYLVLGEGDYTCLELADYLLKGRGKVASIKGIMYRSKSRVIKTAPRPMIKNLDALPMPAYHLLPMDRYGAYATYDVGRKFCCMITTRGCPFRCTYCTSSAIFGHRWRSRSPEKVIEEIKYLYDKFGVRHIFFQDDEFTINHKRTMEICDKITENRLDIIWECLARVSHVDDELLAKMAKAGCKAITYGVECGYEDGLKRINKQITLEQATKAFNLTNKHGIQSRATFIIGFPWEGAEEIRQTIDFAKSLDSDVVYFNLLNPYPRTKIYDEVKDKNLIVANDWDNYRLHGSDPIIRTTKLTQEELKWWSGRAYFEVYTQPRYILKRLLQSTSPIQFKRNIIAGVELIKLSLKRIREK